MLFIILLAAWALPAAALTKEKASSRTERLAYDVYYHWGFIWTKAGYGELTLDDQTLADGSQRRMGQLAAKSLSIVETLMHVRDTLECWYTPEMVPIEYCKKTHEGSYNAVERNRYTTRWRAGADGRRPEDVAASDVHITRWRDKKGSVTTAERRYHIDGWPAYDMLSVFYAIRALDFGAMRKGHEVRFPIYSGIKDADYMTVQYCGTERCELKNGKTYDTYRLELTFRSKDSDQTPLHVWLARTPDHRPIKVTISLQRIGEIQGQIVE